MPMISWSRRLDGRHDAFGTKADDPAPCRACRQPLTPDTAIAVHPNYGGPATLEFNTRTFDVIPEGGVPLELQMKVCCPCADAFDYGDTSVAARYLAGGPWAELPVQR